MGATLAGETPPEQGGASAAGVPPTPQQQEFKSGSGSATSEPKEALKAAPNEAPKEAPKAAPKEAPKAAPQAPPETEAKPASPPPTPEHGEPQVVSNESPKLVKRRSRSGHVVSVLEDIQRLPEDAIYQEFNRLLVHAQSQVKEVADKPCLDMADRLKSCLHHNRQQACECFPAMEQYRQCVIRATQVRVDDKAESEPMVLIPVVPPKSIPRPAKPPQCKQQQRQRSWWRFWTWFK